MTARQKVLKLLEDMDFDAAEQAVAGDQQQLAALAELRDSAAKKATKPEAARPSGAAPTPSQVPSAHPLLG